MSRRTSFGMTSGLRRMMLATADYLRGPNDAKKVDCLVIPTWTRRECKISRFVFKASRSSSSSSGHILGNCSANPWGSGCHLPMRLVWILSTEVDGDSSMSPSDFGSGVLLRMFDCERRVGDFFEREFGGNKILNGEGRGVDWGSCISSISIMPRNRNDGGLQV